MISPQEIPDHTVSPARHRPPVTRARVEARTRELASLEGRPNHLVTRTDYERAKREITGESLSHRQESLLDSPAFWWIDSKRP